MYRKTANINYEQDVIVTCPIDFVMDICKCERSVVRVYDNDISRTICPLLLFQNLRMGQFVLSMNLAGASPALKRLSLGRRSPDL